MSNEKKTNTMSSSQMKRQAREKALAKSKRAKVIRTCVWIAAVVVILAGLGYLIGKQIVKAGNAVTASAGYSDLLDDNGFIKDVTAKNYVDLTNYNSLVVKRSEIEYSDEQVDADIAETLDNYATVDDTCTDPIKDGDSVSIEYVGTVDGVEFEGGSTNGSPTKLTIGSHSYIDDFEEQLIGYTTGDHVSVNVTFPEEYGNEELNGKDAVFEVDIRGIYVTPELTDDFIAENFSDVATTVEEYRQHLKDEKYDENLRTWVESKLVDDSAVRKYPKAYLKNLKSTTKYDDQITFQQTNEFYAQYYGQAAYSSFDEYTGMTEEEYDLSLEDTCKEMEKKDLVYQAILESEGMTVSLDEYRTYMTETTGSDDSVDNMVETYGTGYTVKNMVKEKAIQFAIDHISVQ